MIAFGLLLAGLLALGTGCGVDPPNAPNIPFSEEQIRADRTVVSIGNSLTAGFMNSGLAITGQLNAFPNHLARMAGGLPLPPAFNPGGLPIYTQMPLIVNPGDPATTQQTGIGTTGVNRSALFVDGMTFGITTVPLPADILTLLANATYPLPYDNLGVPGAYTNDALVTTDATNSSRPGNLFYDLILRNSVLPPGATTQIAQLEAHFSRETIVDVDPATGGLVYDLQIPSIVTIWLGGNDLLLGAGTGNPEFGVNMTPVAEFEASFVEICNRVQAFAPNAQVAAGNTQTLLPAFTTVPLGASVPDVGFVPWVTDEANVQFILLNALSDLDPPLGPDYLPGGGSSIPGTLTLTIDEYQQVFDGATGYNAVIERECEARGWAYVDVNGAFSALFADTAATEIYTQLNRIFAWFDRTGDGIPEQNEYSAMTLDGVHPSEKGYAQIANLFAEALNDTYGESYGPQIPIGAVPNRAGFEQVLGGGRAPVDGVLGISFTPSAREVLRAGYGLDD
jgi:lysophospholipase L1-like esterase